MSALPISYPLFRLTLALAAGICLSDAWLADHISLRVQCVALAVLCVAALLLYRWEVYRWRMLFGIVCSLAVATLGSILYQWHRSEVRFSWPSSSAVYTGSVEDFPQHSGKTLKMQVRIDRFRNPDTGKYSSVSRTILLYLLPDSGRANPVCGDRICFYANVSRPVSDANVSGFDYGRYLENQGVSGTALAFSGHWRVLRQAASLTFSQQALSWQEKIIQIYRSWGLQGDVLAIVSALTVGDRSGLDKELVQIYNAAGVSHVLSLSGLHIGILAWILSMICYPLRYLPGGRWITMLTVTVVLWGFAFVSGLSPSVVRAVVMYMLYILASVCTESRFSGFFSLSLAAFLMLLYQPRYLFDVSFQLSYLAVLSILLFMPLFGRLYSPRNKLMRYLWQALSLSMSAQIGTLPLILYYFGTFPTYFLLSNLLVAPLSTCILGFSVLSLVFARIPLAGDWLISGVIWSTSALNDSMAWITRLSGAQMTAVYLTFGQAVLASCVILCGSIYWYARSSRKLMATLLFFNLLLGDILYTSLHADPPCILFMRQGVYLRNGHSISQQRSDTQLFEIGGKRVALLNDARWQRKASSTRLPLEYIYICRGFRGDVNSLLRLFTLNTVVLDEDLYPEYKKRLQAECTSLGLKCIDMPDQGYFSVELAGKVMFGIRFFH